MPKALPSGQDIAGRVAPPSQTPAVTVGKIDYSPLAEGAKAVATGVQGLSSMATRYAEQQQEADDFQTHERFINFKLDQEKKFEDAQRKMPAGGGDFAASWDKSYASDAREFMKAVPQHLRPKYDLGLVEFNGRLSKAAGTAQNNAADAYEKDRLETTLGRLAGGAEADPSRGKEFTDQGYGLIDSSRLSPAVRATLRDRFEEAAVKSQVNGLLRAGKKDEAAALAAEYDRRRPQVPVTSLNPSERGKEAMQFFMSKGWTREQAAGIVGGLGAESSFNTSARNAGDGADGSDSIGVAQWNSTRAQALQRFAAKAGTDWRDFGTQLAFVQHELETTESGAADRLRGARDVRGAAEAFLHFERPKGYEGGLATAHGGDRRLSAATAYASLPGGDQAPQSPPRASQPAGGAPAAEGTAAPAQVAQAPGPAANDSAPVGLMGLYARDAAKKLGAEMNTATGEAYERSIIDGLAGRGKMPTRDEIEKDARLTETSRNVLLRQFDAAAQTQHAKEIDQVQYDALKGKYTLADAEQDWQSGRFKSFEEFNAVRSIALKVQEEAGLATRVTTKLQNGEVLNPRDPDDKKGLEALDKATGVNLGLQKQDPTSQARAILQFSTTGMVGDLQKGVFDGMIRSGTPDQLQFAMSTLDEMFQRNPNAFVDAFGKDIYGTLQAWQSRVDRNPAVFQEWLKQSQDPAHQKAREEMGKSARKIVDKQDDGDLLHRFDMSWRPWSDPKAPMATDQFPGIGVMKAEYADAFTEGYIKNGGDETKAHEFATNLLKQSWGDSKLGGGRMMKFPPENVLPKIGGDYAWAQQQVEDAVRQIAGAGRGDPSTFVGKVQNSPFGQAEARLMGRHPDYSLVPMPQTKAEIDALRQGRPLPDGRTSPVWRLAYRDKDTGEIKDGGWFYFDVKGAREKHVNELKGQQSEADRADAERAALAQDRGAPFRAVAERMQGLAKAADEARTAPK